MIDNDEFVLRVQTTPQEIIRRQLVEKLAADKEGKIRAALIDLGWTPPPDAEEANS
jgi:hypothetical protein